MEIDMGLYSNENKENALRCRVSNNTIEASRPCLADITHKFVPNKTVNRPSKNIGLIKLATGSTIGGNSLRRALPR